MIARTFEDGGVASAALYSPCERYRYALERRWGAGKGLMFVMLNPSTATERRNDPTIERCERRARQMGFGALLIGNLFAFRATRPADLRAAEDPEGSANAEALDAMIAEAGQVIAGWGVHGGLVGAGARFARRDTALWHLGLTQAGHPRHPLYVPYLQKPAPWPQTARYSAAAEAGAR